MVSVVACTECFDVRAELPVLLIVEFALLAHLVHPKFPFVVVVTRRIVQLVATGTFRRVQFLADNHVIRRNLRREREDNCGAEAAHQNPIPNTNRTFTRSWPSNSRPLTPSGSGPPPVNLPQTCGMIVNVAHQFSRV